ncbi:hypothetical protein NIES932_14670 [Raphidiopsis curvata NIES-932]|nr:hypothetical protein NIES932_14670 [Raphidiopsis curvata NIES-932]
MKIAVSYFCYGLELIKFSYIILISDTKYLSLDRWNKMLQLIMVYLFTLSKNYTLSQI